MTTLTFTITPSLLHQPIPLPLLQVSTSWVCAQPAIDPTKSGEIFLNPSLIGEGVGVDWLDHASGVDRVDQN